MPLHSSQSVNPATTLACPFLVEHDRTLSRAEMDAVFTLTDISGAAT